MRRLRGLARPRCCRIASRVLSSGGGGRFLSSNAHTMCWTPRFHGARATTWKKVVNRCQRSDTNWITMITPYTTRNPKPKALVPLTFRCGCSRRVRISINQMAFTTTNTNSVLSRNSSSFSLSSWTAPNMADSGTRQVWRKPASRTETKAVLEWHSTQRRLLETSLCSY